MPNTIDRTGQLIQSRLADLEAEAGQLERALTSLGEESARDIVVGVDRAKAPSLRLLPRRSRNAVRRANAKAPNAPPRPAPGAAAGGDQGQSRCPSHRARQGDRRQALKGSRLIAKARAEKLIVKKGNGYALKG